MKKYFGPIFLIISILAAVVMVKNKPTAVAEDIEKNVPFVKTMILIPQTVNARVSSQGFIKPKIRAKYFIGTQRYGGMDFPKNETRFKL